MSSASVKKVVVDTMNQDLAKRLERMGISQGITCSQPPKDNLDRAKKQLDFADELISGTVKNDFLNALGTVINYMSEAIFVVNGNGVFEMINPLAAQLFGAPREALIGQQWCDFLGHQHKDEYLSLFVSWKKCHELPSNHGPKEVVIHRADSLLLDVDLSLSCLPASQTGSENLFIGVMHNLTTHKAEYHELKRQARTDRLTGLANRHEFDEMLQTSWNDSINGHQPLSLVIIDVDYFKLFNDRYGHVNGDRCLQKIAQVVEKALPSRQCLAARYGGEEFALILPNCNARTAELTAKRVQAAINQLSFTDLGLHPSVRVSVSQGIAVEVLGQYRTPTALVCAADTALYRAKSDGRNRINLSL